MDRASKRAAKAAYRADRSGSGPTLHERPADRFPGAGAKFALLGEVLMTGLLVFVAILVLPAALAAGVRHLRRFVRAEASPYGAFWRDVRDGLLGGLAVGAIAVVVSLVLVADIVVARSGALPGGAAIEIVGWVGLAAVGVALLAAASLWTPESGWRSALRATPSMLGGDIPGALYLVATVVFVGVVTWALAPLIIPALGCAALAAVAIPERPRRGIR